MDQGRPHSILAMLQIPEGVCPLIIIQPSMLCYIALLLPIYKVYYGVSLNMRNELFWLRSALSECFLFL